MMDKLLNSSFYLHLEKGPEVLKRYIIIDVIDSVIKVEKEGKNYKIKSDEIELYLKDLTRKWIDKLYKVALTQTKLKYIDPSYCYKGSKDMLTIKYNQIMLSLCGHVNDDKVKKVFDKFSSEVINYINKNI